MTSERGSGDGDGFLVPGDRENDSNISNRPVLPPPIGRARGSRLAQAGNAEPRPPGGRAIVGASRQVQVVTTDQFVQPGSTQHEPMPSAGRGFLQQRTICPMSKETEHKVILSRLQLMNRENMVLEPVYGVGTELNQSPLSSISTLSMTSTQEEALGQFTLLNQQLVPDQPHLTADYITGGENRNVRFDHAGGVDTVPGMQNIVEWSTGISSSAGFHDFENFQVTVDNSGARMGLTNAPLSNDPFPTMPTTAMGHGLQLSNTNLQDGSGGDTSNLNVNARIFVPTPFLHHPPATDTVSAELNGENNVEASVVQPVPTYPPNHGPSNDSYAQNPSFGFLDNIPPTLTELSEDGAINVLKATLARLIQVPAEMEEATCELNETLNALITREETLSEMVNIIFELVFVQHPFAYTAARLCKQLCDLCPDKDVTWRFRPKLLKTCKKHFTQRKKMNSETFVGFATFIAELYLVCTLPNGDKIDILADVSETLVEDLINCVDVDLQKAGIKVLKCTGVSLSDRDLLLADEKKCMDRLFAAVARVSQQCPDTTVRLMAEKLIDFRNQNWGRDDETPAAPPGESSRNYAEPVFYNQAGQVQTGCSEEDLMQVSSRSSPDIPSDDEIDDEEFITAYADFLIASGQVDL